MLFQGEKAVYSNTQPHQRLSRQIVCAIKQFQKKKRCKFNIVKKRMQINLRLLGKNHAYFKRRTNILSKFK